MANEFQDNSDSSRTAQQKKYDTDAGKIFDDLRMNGLNSFTSDNNRDGLLTRDELFAQDGVFNFDTNQDLYLKQNYDALNGGVKSGISVAGLRAIDFTKIEDAELSQAMNRLSTSNIDSNHDGAISTAELRMYDLQFQIEDNFKTRTEDFKIALKRFDDLAAISQEADKLGLTKSEIREARTQLLANQLRSELAKPNPNLSNDIRRALTEEMFDNRLGRLSEVLRNEYSIENESTHKVVYGRNDYSGKLSFLKNGPEKSTPVSFSYEYKTF